MQWTLNVPGYRTKRDSVFASRSLSASSGITTLNEVNFRISFTFAFARNPTEELTRYKRNREITHRGISRPWWASVFPNWLWRYTIRYTYYNVLVIFGEYNVEEAVDMITWIKRSNCVISSRWSRLDSALVCKVVTHILKPINQVPGWKLEMLFHMLNERVSKCINQEEQYLQQMTFIYVYITTQAYVCYRITG